MRKTQQSGRQLYFRPPFLLRLLFVVLIAGAIGVALGNAIGHDARLSSTPAQSQPAVERTAALR